MWITSGVVKLPRLDLSVEMSWCHSLVQSVGQYVVTLLSMLYSYKLNMVVLYANTSSPIIRLCKGILWLCWNANCEIPLCLEVAS